MTDTRPAPTDAPSDVRRHVHALHASPLGRDVALLLLRLALGTVFLAHGAQKLFGAFDGPGLAGARATVGDLGLQPESLWGLFLALSEFGGGALLVLGLLTLPAGLVAAGNMAVATVFVHGENGLLGDGGFEFTMVLAVSSLVLALVGPGRFSLDSRLRLAPR